ncbi:LacI family DNA-binding transcriptional regulator [Devosia sp. PTR5]|uniref:LacI family DNA-binding transcriptional regulator n=2 Tax=Devosia oryzisoli TaxID=2774138 RepID=A0A927ISV5_9HYPH|nr:LacI family DNA-binding transcriptional regulator [Devosia oryzisoli]
MQAVAERANVSPSTVSLYLRRPEAVAAATGQAITGAIDELGYVPNLVAGGLAAAASRAVSIIVPSVRNAFFAETVAAMQAELGKERLQVMLGHSEYSDREEESLVRTALSWAPSAIVLTGQSHSAGTRKILAAGNTPVVEIWELGGQSIDMTIGFSHDKVGRTAAEYLVGRGRRQLAFLGARMQEDRRANTRAQGFVQEALRLAGLHAEIIGNPARAGVELGALLLGQALERVPDIDGIACSNDHIALGVLFECQRRGISVPGDIAVVGFGDLDFAGSCIPTLTTIRPPGDLIGTEAARVIINHVRGDRSDSHCVIDTGFRLVERQSA